MNIDTNPRQKALLILHSYVKSKSLIHHMLSVEAAMRFYAKKINSDLETWGLTGLLHDFDWEIHPNSNDHPKAGAELLKNAGISEEIISAILTHGDDPAFPRVTDMQKHLYACDEITGFITAVALVRPSRSLSDLTVSSIKKKWKDKAFAAAVDRAGIEQGAAEIGIPVWEHVDNVITAMREISKDLEL